MFMYDRCHGMPLEARGQFLEFILFFAGIELSSSGLVASASVMPALAYFFVCFYNYKNKTNWL